MMVIVALKRRGERKRVNNQEERTGRGRDEGNSHVGSERQTGHVDDGICNV